MNDDTPTPHAELASAAADGAVTEQERALVEASPELVAERDFYLALRGDIADVAAPADDLRERALAAALGVFDDTAPPVIVGPGAVVPLTARRGRGRMLPILAAAAVVGIVVIGAVSAIGNNSGDKKSASTTTIVASLPHAESAPDLATDSVIAASPAGGAATTAAAAATTSSSPGSGSAVAGSTASTTASSTADTSAGTADAPATTPVPAAASTPGSAPSALPVLSQWPAQVQLATPTDVLDFAGDPSFGQSSAADTTVPPQTKLSTAASTGSDSGSNDESPCLTVIHAPFELAYYDGRPAIVERDTLHRQIVAIDAETCDPLVTVALP